MLDYMAHPQTSDTFKAQEHKEETRILLVQSVTGKLRTLSFTEVTCPMKAGSTSPAPCENYACSQEPSYAAINLF